jgi:heptosyltransferase-3
MKYRKYCALRRILYFLWLKDVFVDVFAKLVYKPRLKNIPSNASKKIVFFNSGHLGDALIMSYNFPEIKKKYPDAVIDVVCGDWCKFVFDKNPLVRKVIVQNHFMTNRAGVSEFKKRLIHFKTALLAAKELKKEVYDFSIDVRYSGAVSHWILPFINVKESYGFGSRGYGGLLQKEFFLPDNQFHTYEMQTQLLKEIGVNTTVSSVVPYLPFESVNLEELKKKTNISANSLLIFPEAGEEGRMFDNGFWRKLCAEILEKTPYDLLFCGEKSFTELLFKDLQNQLSGFKNRIDFAGKLRLSEVAALPQIVAAAIVLDSFPAHLCPISCKTLVLGKKAAGYHFFPINNKPTLMFHDHVLSKAYTLPRESFSSQYIENMTNIVEDISTLNTIITFLINKTSKQKSQESF